MDAPITNHDTTSVNCGCMPTLYRPCEDCADGNFDMAERVDLLEFPKQQAGCWRCTNGLVRFDLKDLEYPDDPGPVIVVHHESKP